MQSLALEQPVELGLALRSVGAEVVAPDFVHLTTYKGYAFALPPPMLRWTALGTRPCASRPWGGPISHPGTPFPSTTCSPLTGARQTGGRGGGSAPAGNSHGHRSLRARLGSGCLLLLKGNNVPRTYLAFVLGWAHAFVACSVSPA